MTGRRFHRLTSRALLGGVLVALCAGLGLTGQATAQSETSPTVAVVEPDQLHVMSFNLRFASDTPPNSWPERRPVMKRLLLQERPHVVGTQEGLYQQLRDIEADLPAYYDSIGEGREGGSRGEAMQVFYDSRRLDPEEFGHYWLSDTPDVVGSKTWAGCCPRMVTWIRFTDARSGEQLYLVNTHLEAFSAETRSKSADLILERMQRLDPTLPVLMTGDFNEAAQAGATVYDRLVTNGPLVDTWETAEARGPLFGTFHGYRPLTPNGTRIDWILSSPEVRTSFAAINTYSERGQFPSDHLPVQAVVELPRRAG
jgi:endonuclease/exonuclease/phosphatase family metal-dependent hydrolase